ncbi:RNA-guided endonuclease IscB [Nocardiopsis sp. NPDC055551]|uniref:RNA-guided endonuclease IscB n=1 Tax=Nocardiopsis sp. NPDC006832 TaxID=3157188 RepID=UPI00340F10BD
MDKNQIPLQPCHPARARKLLHKGRAVVARHTPFTIRLKDRTIAESEVDGVQVGIDPGSKHTGIAVFTHQGGQRRGRYSIQLDHRGAQVRKKMGQRSAYRRRRRTANLRHRAPRFANRTRPQGWLAPSLRHRVETTTAWVDRLTRWAPVKAVHMERVAFDTHALDALAVGKVDTITQTTDRVLIAGCAGRGSYARTRPDKHGFPRLSLPRTKGFFGFTTGDLVRAVVPQGKKAGTHTGRVAVRASGSFNITTTHGTIQGIGHKYMRLLQRADGYGYTWKGEGVSSRPSRTG